MRFFRDENNKTIACIFVYFFEEQGSIGSVIIILAILLRFAEKDLARSSFQACKNVL